MIHDRQPRDSILFETDVSSPSETPTLFYRLMFRLLALRAISNFVFSGAFSQPVYFWGQKKGKRNQNHIEFICLDTFFLQICETALASNDFLLSFKRFFVD